MFFKLSSEQEQAFKNQKINCYPDEIFTDYDENNVVFSFNVSTRMRNFVKILERIYKTEPLDNPERPVTIRHTTHPDVNKVTVSGDIAYTVDFLKTAELITDEDYQKMIREMKNYSR